MSNPYELSDDTPVYVISVAAELSNMHPQTLRAYDRMGLVSPGRSQGRGRRYSMRDILALREIQRLSREGINLNGIKLLLEQLREIEKARRLIAELHAEVAQLRVELESTRAVAARLAELRRSSSDTRSGHEGREGLVPVRSARVAVWEPITGPSSESGPPRGDK
jgi:MerR family transcriptional regulator, heat shock protein HspR